MVRQSPHPVFWVIAIALVVIATSMVTGRSRKADFSVAGGGPLAEGLVSPGALSGLFVSANRAESHVNGYSDTTRPRFANADLSARHYIRNCLKYLLKS